MKIDRNGWLEGEAVRREACDKNSGPFDHNLPDTVVIHYTGAGSVDSAVRTLTDPSVQASAHLVIGQQGELVQMIPFSHIAWHAGKSHWKNRSNLNHCSLGIELDNPGYLTKTEGKYISWFGKEYDSDEVVFARHNNENSARYWFTYPEEQLVALQQVLELLLKTCPISDIVGHDEIAPKRKQDPGPAFPMDKIRNRFLFNDRKNEPEEAAAVRPGQKTSGEQPPEKTVGTGLVTANRLNIRRGPSTDHPTAADPLTRGQKVQILEEKEGWYRVSLIVEGWVSTQYIKTL